uniref:Uncharacterized protein n=1 Tax=Solanum tuberosum TaxID=4113 RepID=M1DIZ4_SOLTU
MTKFFAVTKDVLTTGLEFGRLVLSSELLTTGDDQFLTGRNCPITTGFPLLETNFPFAKDPFSCGGWMSPDSSNTSHEMGTIDVRLLDIVEIFDIVLVAHLTTVPTVNTHAF